jgi:ABC-type oligopeptide transport system ATPase subunit
MRALAMMEIDTVQSVEKSHFLRMYETERQKVKRARQLNPELIKSEERKESIDVKIQTKAIAG